MRVRFDVDSEEHEQERGSKVHSTSGKTLFGVRVQGEGRTETYVWRYQPLSTPSLAMSSTTRSRQASAVFNRRRGRVGPPWKTSRTGQPPALQTMALTGIRQGATIVPP